MQSINTKNWMRTTALCGILLSGCGDGSAVFVSYSNDNWVDADFYYRPVRGNVNVPYRQAPDFSYCCNVRPRFWIDEGSLPPGLGISAGDGVISGTPTQAGNWSFTVCLEFKNINGRQCQNVSARID